jgi:hypothetical protein
MKKKARAILIVLSLIFTFTAPAAFANRAKPHRHHGKAHKVMAVATPIAIGAAFGPAGSIGYQGFKHRRFIKHHLVGHGRHSGKRHRRH